MQKSKLYKNVPNHQPNEFSVFSRLEKGEQCFFCCVMLLNYMNIMGPPHKWGIPKMVVL